MWTFRNEPPPIFSMDSDRHRQPAKQQHGAGLWHMPESWKQEFCSIVVCCVCIDGYLDATKVGASKKRSKIRKCRRLWAKIPPGLAPCYAAAISSQHSSGNILPRKSQLHQHKGTAMQAHCSQEGQVRKPSAICQPGLATSLPD